MDDAVISPELAYKMAVFISYADAPSSVKESDSLYATTNRKLVDIREINTLSGVRTFYSITLYRGEGEPIASELINSDIVDWAEECAAYAEEGEEAGVYVPRDKLDGESRKKLSDKYPSIINEIRDYWYCIVPKTAPQRFYQTCGPGISPYWVMPEFGRQIIAIHSGVVIDEVTIEEVDYFGYVVCRVGEEKYAVSTPVSPLSSGSGKVISYDRYLAMLGRIDEQSKQAFNPDLADNAKRWFRVVEEIPISSDWSVVYEDVIPLVEENGLEVIGASVKSEGG